MKNPLYLVVMSLICLALLTVSPAQAAYLLLNDVLSTGGGHVESAGYLLDYSTGQVAVGQSMGLDHIESGGFWGWQLLPPAVAVEEETPELLPSSHALSQNYPNPFNPETHIGYQLPAASHVSLVVFNVTGQIVCRLVDELQMPGSYTATWKGVDQSGRAVASGIYFYRLTCGEFQQVRKMLLLK
jgi:hypothetical protein